jgi:FtsP/CotA-like multicopper oxidase with cupredoxin domain
LATAKARFEFLASDGAQVRHDTAGDHCEVAVDNDRAGLFVWHCHIVEHEDHEMMRPYRIGP